MLKIKPILQIQGEKLDSFAKTRTMARGTKIMKEAITKDIKDVKFVSGTTNVNLSTSDYKVEYVNDNTNAKAVSKKDVEVYIDRYWKL